MEFDETDGLNFKREIWAIPLTDCSEKPIPPFSSVHIQSTVRTHTYSAVMTHTDTLRCAPNTRNYSWQKRHKQLIRPRLNKPATDQPTQLHLLLRFPNTPSETSIHRHTEHSEIVSLSTRRSLWKLLAATIKALNDKNSLLEKGRKGKCVCACACVCGFARCA